VQKKRWASTAEDTTNGRFAQAKKRGRVERSGQLRARPSLIEVLQKKRMLNIVSTRDIDVLNLTAGEKGEKVEKPLRGGGTDNGERKKKNTKNFLILFIMSVMMSHVISRKEKIC